MEEPRGRLACCALVSLLAAAALLAGCGGGGDAAGGGGSVADEKASDANVVNVAISQEMTLIEGLEAGLPLLRRPEAKALYRQLIAQEREHLDGWTKAMRGLGAEVEAEAEELDLSESKSEGDALLSAYELTGIELTHFLDDVTHLHTAAPQSFAASIAASEAQHLVSLRRLLGAGLLESVPEAFDTGEVPPPARFTGNPPVPPPHEE
jgi:rubrerythrin